MIFLLMVVFLIIIFSVYLAINYYIYRHGKSALPLNKFIRGIYTLLFSIFVFLYPVGKLVEQTGNYDLAKLFIFPGSFWLAAILYFLIFVLLIDFVRVLNRVFKFYPKFILENLSGTKLYVFFFVLATTAFLIFAGWINASKPVVKEVYLKVDKKVSKMKTLRIALVSDIHLGMIHGRDFAEQLVLELQHQQPDIILLAGDILDEDVDVVVKEKSGEALSHLHPKYGVWGVTGNHEYYGGVGKSVRYLRGLGIKMLRDSRVNIDGKFYIVGREDYSSNRIAKKKRKSLKQIMDGVDLSEPVILMDHQPINLSEAESQGVDLQLSGHTHRGQLWPLNIMTNAIYELSYGYLQKGSTHYFVSAGYGTWGPPVRIGNSPEIVILTVTFN